MKYLLIVFLTLFSLPAYADAAADMTTHWACVAHKAIGLPTTYQEGWATCTAFEASYATTLASLKAARLVAKATRDLTRDETAQARLAQ